MDGFVSPNIIFETFDIDVTFILSHNNYVTAVSCVRPVVPNP